MCSVRGRLLLRRLFRCLGRVSRIGRPQGFSRPLVVLDPARGIGARRNRPVQRTIKRRGIALGRFGGGRGARRLQQDQAGGVHNGLKLPPWPPHRRDGPPEHEQGARQLAPSPNPLKLLGLAVSHLPALNHGPGGNCRCTGGFLPGAGDQIRLARGLKQESRADRRAPMRICQCRLGFQRVIVICEAGMPPPPPGRFCLLVGKCRPEHRYEHQ